MPKVVQHAVLRDFASRCLEEAGSTPENAALVADVLVEADLRGIPSHGVNRLYLYCDELKRGTVDRNGKPCIISDNPSLVLVDGNNAQGAVVAKYCMDVAIERARATGMAMVTARKTNHYGIAGYWAMLASAQGMVGLSFTNTSPLMFPTRSRAPCLGTNPIACAAPSMTEPVVLDMATTSIPLGRAEVAQREGRQLLPGLGVNSAGADTLDPNEVLDGGGLRPLGGTEETAGYKGYGLATMVELLCGCMAGSKIGSDIPQSMNPQALSRFEIADLAATFMVIDPSKLGETGAGYAQRVQLLTDQLHGLPVAADSPGPVLVAGEKEYENKKRQSEAGITLSDGIANALVQLAEELKQAPPAFI